MPAEVDGMPIYVGEGLQAAGAYLNSESLAAAEKLHRLQQQLAPLQEDWRQSVAAAYYENMREEWELAAAGLFGPDGVLGVIAEKMNVAWTNYFDAESANISTWRH